MNAAYRKINKILLISPHNIITKGYREDLVPPLGLAYLAAILEQEQYEVKVLDLAAEDFYHREEMENGCIVVGLSYEETKNRIRDFKPDMVGVSCLFSTQFNDMLKLCELAKRLDKKIVTVVGGAHPSALPEQSLKNPYVNFVCIGESEYTLRLVIESLNGDGDVSHIDGLGYKINGKILVNPKTRFIEDLDSLPFPARHLLPMETYFKVNIPHAGTSLKSPNTSIMTSRGCTANCAFCATTRFWGRRFRTRSPENVLHEMESLIKAYGIKELSLIDDNFTLDKERAFKILQGMIDHRLNLVWNTPNGLAAWVLDEELLSKMKEAGCYEVTFAIESGDQEVLNKIIKKPLKLDRVERLVRHGKKIGLIVHGYFVIGFPGETKELMQKTIDFAKRLKFDVAGIFIATPLPGTELYGICKEKGYLKPGFTFEKMHYGKGNIVTSEFTPEEVEKIASKAIIEINMSLLFRNPLKFFRKYSKHLFSNPGELIRYFFMLLRQSRTGR